MSDSGLSEPALTAGLLMEGAQSQQQLAASALDALRAHTAGLDAVVRDEIHRTLVEVLSELSDEVAQATRRLDTATRRLRWRAATLGLSLVAVGIAAPVYSHWWLPTPASLAALEAQQATLNASVARLRREGGRVQLRQCGIPARLCIRIDTRSPRFGADGDFAVLAGE